MSKLLTAAVLAAAALCTSACGTLTGSTGGSVNDTILKIATDPSCGHTDELHVVFSPVPTGSLDLKRNCGAAQPSPAAPDASAPAQ